MTKYKIGEVEAETKQELGKKTIEHVGLALEDDELIGKKFKFKNPKWPAEQGIYTVVGRQMLWGYDENGKYCMIPGYRGTSEDNPFGKPFQLQDVEFIEKEVK